MDLDELVTKYVDSAQQVFAKLEISEVCVNVCVEDIKRIVDYSKDYFEDAGFYKKNRELGVSLASIAYCEGLLDALRLLGAVNFEWPKSKERKEE